MWYNRGLLNVSACLSVLGSSSLWSPCCSGQLYKLDVDLAAAYERGTGQPQQVPKVRPDNNPCRAKTVFRMLGYVLRDCATGSECISPFDNHTFWGARNTARASWLPSCCWLHVQTFTRGYNVVIILSERLSQVACTLKRSPFKMELYVLMQEQTFAFRPLMANQVVSKQEMNECVILFQERYFVPQVLMRSFPCSDFVCSFQY